MITGKPLETKQVLVFKHSATGESKTIEIPIPAVGMAIFDAIHKAFGDGPDACLWSIDKAWTE